MNQADFERHGGKFPTTDCAKRAQICVYGGIISGIILTPFTVLVLWLFFTLNSLNFTLSFIGEIFVIGKIVEYATFGMPYNHPCNCSRCSTR